MLMNGPGFILGMMKMFWNYIVVMVAQPYEYTETHWIVHFMVHGLYLNCADKEKKDESKGDAHTQDSAEVTQYYLLKSLESGNR